MARDTIERDGEELVVETGTGHVTSITEGTGKRNLQVAIKATHTDLRMPITAWVDTHDETLFDLVRKARDEAIEIEYRIEVHRKSKVAKTIPIDKVANVDKVRDLVTVAPAGTAGTGEPDAPGLNDQPPAPDASLPEEPPPDPQPAEPQSPPPERRAPRMAESRPWDELNSDGSPNLGAYAVTAGAGIVDLAVELLVDAGVELKLAAIRTVAVDLMTAADGIQAGATGYRADRMANSHTRARHLLRTVLRARPYPVDTVLDEHGAIKPSAAKAAGAWTEKAIPAGVALLRVAVELAGIDWRAAA